MGLFMSHGPAVSVIVPCYKVTDYIADALGSLRAQTFRDFETVVINDGCPDTANLEAALAPYRDEIVYLKQSNQGLSAARNAAIRRSRGKLVALLDGDDMWEPNYLAEHIAILDSHPDVDAVYPNARMFGDNPWAGRLFSDTFPSRGEVTFLSVLQQRCCIYVGLTARREAMERVGLFDTDLRAAEDLDLWLRMLHAGSRFAYHTQPLVRQRLHRFSLSDDQTRMARAVLRVYAKLLGILDLAEEERDALVDQIGKVNAQINLLGARRALYSCDRREALKHFTRANRVMRNSRLAAAIWTLRVCPRLLFTYVHTKFKTEESYVR
jgi:glycosyltransferase involved in cell wall biosynthesis